VSLVSPHIYTRYDRYPYVQQEVRKRIVGNDYDVYVALSSLPSEPASARYS